MSDIMDTTPDQSKGISTRVSAGSVNLPWVEKYRPTGLDQLISHQDIIQTIQRFIKEDRLPHLLFYGPPGTGKTSTIKACAQELYGVHIKSMVLELNASDTRGIDVVREQIKNFASTRTVFNSGFKLVILDEADAMTNEAQAALRRVIEKFTKNTRFCMICNYVSKIIPALQSRCTRFRFAPLTADQMRIQIDRVVASEGVNVSADGYDALIKLATGDMRKALNMLQSTSMGFAVVDMTTVYLCTGHPLPTDIATMVQWMLTLTVAEAYDNMLAFKTLKGHALQDILSDVHEFIHGVDFPVGCRIFLLDQMGRIEERLAVGGNEKLQLSALVGAFRRAREMVTVES